MQRFILNKIGNQVHRMNNKNLMKKSVLLGATLGLLCSAPSLSFAKEYYKWVDSKGTTHYTTTPPPKSSKSRGKIDTYGYRTSIPATSTAQQNSSNTSSNNNSSTANPAQAPTTSNTPQTQSMDSQQRDANAALQNGAVERVDVR